MVWFDTVHGVIRYSAMQHNTIEYGVVTHGRVPYDTV